MHPFTFTSATGIKPAVETVTGNAAAKFVAGGTNLIDLMKMHIETPAQLVDITGLGLNKIEPAAHGGILIGALVSNSDIAYNKDVIRQFPVLSEAILAGASPQLRNMATTGGNILQRTRCYYFYDTAMPCNKRVPGSGCSAIKGYNRMHAVLGTSEKCIATHPSDMCVALAALEAVVHVSGQKENRTIAFEDFHILPGDTPEKENVLKHGELITGIEIPALSYGAHSTYVKVRDRHSYEFALCSAAVALDISAGTIRNARLALGGVGTKPWRAKEAEQSLQGQKASAAVYRNAAELALKDAKTYEYNSFKPELAKRTIISALQKLQEV